MRVLLATGGPGQTEIGIQQLMLLMESAAFKPTVLTVVKHAGDQQEGAEVLAHAAKLLDPVFDTVQYKTRVGQPWEEIVAEGIALVDKIIATKEKDVLEV